MHRLVLIIILSTPFAVFNEKSSAQFLFSKQIKVEKIAGLNGSLEGKYEFVPTPCVNQGKFECLPGF